jgi:hypothetical protein
MRIKPTDKTLDRLMAFHDHSPKGYAALAFDAQAAAWMLYDHIVFDGVIQGDQDRFRWELRERWEAMWPGRRSLLRGKGKDWLRAVYFLALAKSGE